ncbi:acetyl-CoA carboxylase biotin carboxyl carrier protein subunit [Streptomyces sp. H10-C2]|uniref:acetyl-CoA carboxylase biotin carboxyl carrier protein n=1 Tax=unclassified Streptomyces TaxID=2593676 RepID=UPI0024B92719|nr:MULTISPECIES: biotin/lipoyl-containing protein [unclassified Streptomyces]MDJ0345175.1 acetyl-CoA carboxylase biotin carboxyl carrier protein subunit [Streptomyces sp. PH10-H1]MDJ0374143.1 acetyl-CoA carboxylase biotin carboxyl carrier protein subunit [Streptomyces sp. H10-C2]
MTTDRDQSEPGENGGRTEDGARDVPGPNAESPAGAVLDAVFRSVAQLAGTTPDPPRRIRMQDGTTTVEVEWPDPVRAQPVPAGVAAVPAGAVEVPAGAAAVNGTETGQAVAEPADDLRYLRAPMVGTFYHAGAPDAQPYVKVGDVVRPGQEVGILEAMKMMSTLTADEGGRVVEMLVPNAQAVQFDQQLIALAPVAAGADDE